ncbi:D12 class N6 adenine-specific DNA methyltransferase family protein [Paraburkholderia xenovorans LB400]|nr:D12 class N6 adenine-specific DNA methyltransferase family protein [Paraburkholderia xenovorans LB400]
MVMSIVPWIGGKRRLADILIPRFPPYTCYVEVFAGAAALFFLRPPAEVEVLNDVNDLVNLLSRCAAPSGRIYTPVMIWSARPSGYAGLFTHVGDCHGEHRTVRH